MQFLTSLFGEGTNSVLTTVIALVLVVLMIIAGVWLLKLLFSASGRVGRGRNRRLTIIDAMNVDQKRQLMIVRRDNVEHLILTGGPQDLVIESGIPVEKPVAPVRRPVPAPKTPKTVTMPKPQAAPAPQEAPIVPITAERPVRSAADRLRDFERAAGQRSIRETGLLRQSGRTEPGIGPENPDQPFPDSDRSEPLTPRGQKKGGDDNFGAYRGDIKASGDN
jgi:flagellar protein FliO/FliZ